jgi:hypothetical protein
MARIVTASNAGYIERIKPYLESLSRHSQIPATLVCVGDFVFDPHLPGVDSVMLTRQENYGAPLDTESPQHGAWLQVVPGEPDDVAIFTDGDIVMQRPFSARELDWLASLDDNTIAAGYNSGPDETLAVEGARLFPRFPLEAIGRRFDAVDIFTTPCYNIGVMAARRSVYQRIYDAYMPLWETVSEAFGHMARQQWLVCYVIAALGIRVDVTPYSWHANGHYGMPPGCRYGPGGLLYAGDDVVLMRHKL